ncbi:MAG: GntR family transcriptional regulator, partial [Armatimonadota bacterium]|nr:GntR family transcriptional regulator [Armatimonadota bacterium]
MPFQRILTKKKSTHVAEQILQAIMSGQYRVGDRLPPERVLAEEMGVSRPSVREALSALQIVGVVASRVGDGTYVRSAVDTAEAL